MISKITDKSMAGAAEWQNRMLDPVYPIVYMDGLRGLHDAIRAAFPNGCIQNCIIHQIRNSIKYVSYKDKKVFMSDLKLVYKADTEELTLSNLDELKRKWNDKYGSVVDS